MHLIFRWNPQPTKRLQLVAIGLGVGLFIALLLMALRFWLDKRIQSPEQAESLIGMPVAAVFPTVKKPRVYTKASLAARSMFEQLFNAINIEVTQNTTKTVSAHYHPLQHALKTGEKLGGQRPDPVV